MEPGEKELKLAFEQTTTNNVRAMLEHGNETRRLLRELEERISLLEGIIRQQDTKFETIRSQLASIQQKVFSGGTA